MAIPFLNHLDVKGNISLNDYKLQDFVVDHSNTSAAGNTAGKLIYDSGSLKFYNGSWQTLGTSGGSVTSVAIAGTDGIDVDSGSPITGSGTITLGLSAIGNSKLANSTVSYGGVSLALGETDATPAFDLQDATGYPTSSLTGTITNAQLAGSIAAGKLAGSIGNAKLSNSSVAYGGVTLSLGGSDATPAFDLTDATNYPTSSLSGTITNAQLAGSIANAKLANSSITIDGSAVSLGGSVTTLQLGTSGSTALAGNTTVNDVSVGNLKTALASGFASNAVTIGDTDDVVTIGKDLVVTGDLTVSGDTITANVGTLEVEDKNITVNKGSGDTSSTADGAGLTIQDAVDASNDASLTWNASNDKFVFSHLIDAPGTSIFVNCDISGDVDIDGTLETDALTIGGVTSVPFESADHSKLDGIEALADVTDATNVTAAGALMDSELTDLAGVKGVTISTLQPKPSEGAFANGDKTKLDGIAAGAQVNVATNLSQTTATGSLTIASSTGTNITVAEATGSIAGLMSTAHHDKLDGIAASATANAAASITETKAGSNASKFVTPDGLAGKSITATIDVSAMDATELKALIDHDLDTPNVVVEVHGLTSKEVYICEYHKDNNGSASDDHLTFHFAEVPSEDLVVTVTSCKGATSITPTYPAS